MTDLPSNIRPNPLTPEILKRVAGELNALAAERDKLCGFSGRASIEGLGCENAAARTYGVLIAADAMDYSRPQAIAFAKLGKSESHLRG